MDVSIAKFIEENTTTKKSRYLKSIQVENFWSQGYKGKDIVIAVIDTGCDINHPDLRGKIIDGYNFTEEQQGNIKSYHDFNGHGTHVSGIIVGKNTGVAPDSKILSLKILDQDGNGKVENLIKAIHYALEWKGPHNEKVRVICLSLGSKENNLDLHKSIKEAIKKQVSVVVASGNDGDGTDETHVRYPGYYNEVIEVGALDYSNQIARFSNHNNQLDLVAPGTKVYSTYLDGEFREMSGTSMAAPFVAGSLALIIQGMEDKFQRRLSETEVYGQLIKRTSAVTGNYLLEGNGGIKLFL